MSKTQLFSDSAKSLLNKKLDMSGLSTKEKCNVIELQQKAVLNDTKVNLAIMGMETMTLGTKHTMELCESIDKKMEEVKDEEKKKALQKQRDDLVKFTIESNEMMFSAMKEGFKSIAEMEMNVGGWKPDRRDKKNPPASQTDMREHEMEVKNVKRHRNTLGSFIPNKNNTNTNFKKTNNNKSNSTRQQNQQNKPPPQFNNNEEFPHIGKKKQK